VLASCSNLSNVPALQHVCACSISMRLLTYSALPLSIHLNNSITFVLRYNQQLTAPSLGARRSNAGTNIWPSTMPSSTRSMWSRTRRLSRCQVGLMAPSQPQVNCCLSFHFLPVPSFSWGSELPAQNAGAPGCSWGGQAAHQEHLDIEVPRQVRLSHTT